jgi:hypothetical protein
VTGALQGPDSVASRADDIYEALLRAHAGLSDPDSAALNARLILLLANEVGDADRVLAAIVAARAPGAES